nr:MULTISPECIES: transposase [unclassified Limnothrix]
MDATQLDLPLFATAASVLPSNETISLDKSSSCETATPMPKSSKTSDQVLTSSEKDCNPYWSDSCAAISSKLWLPVETDCVDSDSSCSSSWFNKTVANSWFLTHLFTAQNPNSQRICSPSFTSSLVECPDSEVTGKRSRKIRIFLNPDQKALLKQWFGVSRYVYNATIKHLQEPGTKANWMAVAPIILGALPEWAKPVPYQIKKIAVKDACTAVREAKKGFKKDGQIRKCRFRSRKDRQQTIYIPKSAISENGVYYTILGKAALKESIPDGFSDGRLTLAYGEYYLITSTEVQPIQSENQGRVVALDPGVRTFMTFFAESSYGWIGNDSNLLIQKLCFKLDRLISKITKAKSAQKRRLKKAADRLRSKVQHLVKELHHKTARFLTENFDVILLPSFESSQMVSKSRRKIKSKTVRQMLTLSHYQFKRHLEWKAWELGKIALTNINEAYTSKTVSWTGEIVKIGGSRVIKSKVDGRSMNRDLNGARGIFLRALVDTPWLRDHLNLCIC